MMKSLGTEFKVGLFAIVALATLGYMLFVLSPDSFKHKEYDSYYTILNNASGIVGKTHVKTAGVSIGKVRSVALEGGQTKVKFDVDRTVVIPVGSRIEIRSVGLLGDKHLEIVRPKDETARIEPGGFVPQSSEGTDIESLIAVVGDVARDVKKVTKVLGDVFGSKKGEQQVQAIVDNFEAITADVRATTKALRGAIGEREGDLQELVTNVRDGVRDLRKVAANLRGIVSDENKERIDRILASFDATMVDVRGSAKSINLITERVEKGEGTIGKLVNDDSTLADIQGAIKDIRKVLAPATRLQVDFDYHGEVRRDQTSQHYVNLLFRTRPDRYFLVGFTDTTYEERETTTESVPADPGKTTIKESIRDRKALRFNLQMAKRWYDFVARAGFFESTGGIASDYYLFGDRLKFTGEAFDVDFKDRSVRRSAHLKFYASVLFYNHISAMIGIDDPTKTDLATGKARTFSKSWFVGAGLTFNDDDLKALFGTAALVATPR